MYIYIDMHVYIYTYIYIHTYTRRRHGFSARCCPLIFIGLKHEIPNQKFKGKGLNVLAALYLFAEMFDLQIKTAKYVIVHSPAEAGCYNSG